MHTCPKCGGSDRLAVGAFPLNCDECGWSYLNEYECRICKKPAVSCMHVTPKEAVYGCPDHPFSDEEFRAAFEEFWKYTTRK